jgi:hypothetical protein
MAVNLIIRLALNSVTFRTPKFQMPIRRSAFPGITLAILHHTHTPAKAATERIWITELIKQTMRGSVSTLASNPAFALGINQYSLLPPWTQPH